MKTKVGVTLLLIAALLIGLVACTPGGSAAGGSGKLKIGVSLPTQREQRWVWDYVGFMDAADAAGVEVIIQIADNNAARQQAQCENLITMGVKALIVAPHDEGAAINIVKMAQDAKIPIISYDRQIDSPDINCLATFDQYRIGFQMGDYMAKNLDAGNIIFLKGDPGDSTCVPLAQGAKDAMKAKLDSGAFIIVAEQDCIDWEPSAALRHTENALTANNNNIQGVIAPNDGTAGGAIQALAAQGLAGRVIVTGQDCETDAVKRIITGTQSMTVNFDCKVMSAGALDAAIKLANGAASVGEFHPDYGVATLIYDVIQIDKNNWHRELVASGLFDEEEFM
jgi:D-xylose transport system substrate-binding protein